MSVQGHTGSPARRRTIWLVGVAAVAVVVLLAAIALRRPAAPSTPAATDAAATVASAESVHRIRFDSGAKLSAEASEELARIADAARGGNGSLRIVGYHASGDAADAMQRAEVVRHALEANGIETKRLHVLAPARAADGGDAREPRRVDVTIE